MAKYRSLLPQLSDKLWLCDGGLETTLIFNEGIELPDFAAFHLLRNEEGRKLLRKYFLTYVEIAKRFGTGLILESVTWRASADWGDRLGYSRSALAEANMEAIRMLQVIRNAHESAECPMVISGCMGPRGDGYIPDTAMSAEQAAEYHKGQIKTLAGAGADMVTAITMNYVDEAHGIVLAAQRSAMPVAISFTLETDGNLPTGQTLRSAIEEVDAATLNYPAYYLINCAHPSHFDSVLTDRGAWKDRIRGVRANASRRSHTELNDAPELDSGNPVELAEDYARLTDRLPHFNIMGGCCGTDHRHIEQIAETCSPLFASA
ncbi:MAG: homocysteine S-methyltransferase family protein [Gemmatimonadota bacterium]|nr:homocysteine S-methyltransferase family protein [Gemmatimonadota bacterium]